ncbi:MAG: 8-amino-7-oxononanoate synthase [Desulfoplanes sp.]|nr:8-amino-7-oxononanoate synthase [Desulfoplanes sp.]MDD4649597.1 8-amino-7-oxononanoate synthase [Desulfoplanes sp.]
MPGLTDWISVMQDDLQRSGRLRKIPAVDYGADLMAEVQGKKVLNLASNNYLGLSGHPEMKAASIKAIETYGTSSGASRLVSGNFSLYGELESSLASLKKQEKSLVLGSGYAANLALCGTFADRRTVVFSDRLNHASIVDGIILSRARQVRYRHNDMDHLAHCLEKYRDHPRKLLITDSVFSMDGDRADLMSIVRLCKDHSVPMAVDEAHATGILGNGRGLACELGVEKEIDLHMGTLSKGLGSHGGFIAGDHRLIAMIANRGRSFIFSTALPPAVIGAGLCGVQLVRAHPQWGRDLLRHSEAFRQWLLSSGFTIGPSTTQIIPVILGDNNAVLAARDSLLANGILVSAIRPPTVPEGTARLRLALRSDLGRRDMEHLRSAFTVLRQEMG